MTSRVYSKTVALGPVVEANRNAGAATRVWYVRNLLGVGGLAHPIILMASAPYQYLGVERCMPFLRNPLKDYSPSLCTYR
jgi:hypothetical protein